MTANKSRKLVIGDAVRMDASSLDFDPKWMAIVTRILPAGGVWLQPTSGGKLILMSADELILMPVGTLR